MKILSAISRRILMFLPVLMLFVFSSCYTDYGLETDNYDVVITLYDDTFNFGAVTKYYLSDSLKVGNDINASYKSAIFTELNENFQELGWTKVNTIGAADVIVSAGVTQNTTTVTDGGGCWWDYWGYYYCYPSYGYTYTYTTGTLFVLLNDKNDAGVENDQPEWVVAINGLADQGNVVSRINTTIEKAFSQSPYLNP